MNFTINFNEKVTSTLDIASKSTQLNVGYFIIQKICDSFIFMGSKG